MMMHQSRGRLVAGCAVTMGLLGAWLVVPGCGGEAETPVAPGANAAAQVVGPTLNKKKLKVDVSSRRQRQREQEQAKPAG